MSLKTGYHSKHIAGFAVLCSCLLLVSATLSACSCKPQLDTSLLTDAPCVAPCWHNITPGISGEDDVRGQLESSPFVRKGSLKHSLTGQPGKSLSRFSWQAQGSRENALYLKDGKVLRIHIALDYDLTLGEVVDKFGSPETAYAAIERSPYLEYYIIVDYPTQGLEFSTPAYPYDPYKAETGIVLSRELEVTGVVYFAPTTPHGMLSEVFLFAPDLVDHYMTNSQKWEGFEHITFAEEYR